MASPQWKLIVADVYLDNIEMVTVVSESWLMNKEDLFYPPSHTSGLKLQKFIRDHQDPDEETWKKYPYNLIKLFGGFLFYSLHAHFIIIFFSFSWLEIWSHNQLHPTATFSEGSRWHLSPSIWRWRELSLVPWISEYRYWWSLETGIFFKIFIHFVNKI